MWSCSWSRNTNSPLLVQLMIKAPCQAYHHRLTHESLHKWAERLDLCVCVHSVVYSWVWQSTYGRDWCVSWLSGWSCCQRCECGRRPWPRSGRSARFSSGIPSRSNPHSARTKGAGGPGSWGTFLLSSPSRQTPSWDTFNRETPRFQIQSKMISAGFCKVNYIKKYV